MALDRGSVPYLPIQALLSGECERLRAMLDWVEENTVPPGIRLKEFRRLTRKTGRADRTLLQASFYFYNGALPFPATDDIERLEVRRRARLAQAWAIYLGADRAQEQPAVVKVP